jgi:RNA polymerase sigma-70 factor (ECF subfamily)
MCDDILIQQIVEEDTQAFGKLVQRYQRRIVRFAERMLGEADAAQDIAQETFLRLWRARSRLPLQGNLGCYLFRIARNLCLDYLRSAHTTETLDDQADLLPAAGSDLAASVQAKALAEAVRCIVQALPEPQRVVFILSHYEELSYQEIAEVIGCPVGTVASRKYQAVETLRRRLAPWREGEARG